MASDAAVSVSGLRFRYGEREVLRGVSFEVKAGELFGLLGPNGGGKTTVFRILTTLAAPGGGAASVFGSDLASDPDGVRRKIGVVFQAPSLDKKLRLLENLENQGHLYGLSGAPLRERCQALLQRFGLADRARDLVETLSGGMRRRVELAKGLLHGPRLLVMDEPTTGLDPGARREFWGELDAVRRGGGAIGAKGGASDGPSGATPEGKAMTVLFTTHLMEEADRCDRVAILDAGLVVALGTPAALKAEIGGDVVLARPAPGLAAEALREEAKARCGLEGTLLDGALRVETKAGPDAVRRLAEALGDRLESVVLGRPTLEDVFIRKTGKRFEGGAR